MVPTPGLHDDVEPTPANGDSRRRQRLDAAFSAEEEAGFLLATKLRVLGLTAIAAWVTIENGFPDALFFYAFFVGFAALGLIPLWLRRTGRYRARHRYLFPLFDCLLAVTAILAPNPFDQTLVPAPMQLRFGNEIYLFVFLAVAAFSYSPRVVLFTGLAAALSWSLGVLWVISQPETVLEVSYPAWSAMTRDQRIANIMDPHRVFYGPWGRLVVVLLVISAALAAAVTRSRRLVTRQAEAERERANLSRYFSANLVDELADSDQPVTTSVSQDVAILFADIVGFTAMSAHNPPDEVIDLLKDFHARIESAVFAHDGTIDKYIGDGAMVTFGTPRPGEQDATNAIRCARALLASIDDWNRERAASGSAPVRIAIGLHHGPVIAGDVGGPQRLEYTVIGDSVNVASRIERLTRELDTVLLVSDELLSAARREGRLEPEDVEDLVEIEPRELRGRDGALTLHALITGRGVAEQGDRP